MDDNFVLKGGKYVGKTVGWLRSNQPNYLRWVEENQPNMLKEVKKTETNFNETLSKLKPNLNFDNEGLNNI